MDTPQIKYIHSGEIMVAATYETADQDEVSASFPMTVLIYVARGNKHYRHNGEEEVFPEGSYMLIRKFTDGTLHKSPGKSGQRSKSYAFALTDEYVRRIIDQFHISQNLPPVKKRVMKLEKNNLLENLMAFIQENLDTGTDIDKNTLHVKTKEALSGIIEAEPALAAVFREYTLAQRTDLTAFMNQSFLLRMPLKALAIQSGRSLSTFNREFKMIFGETPHRWIMTKRLSLARDLMAKMRLSPSDVYIQAGFEDLAHFSRSFKKQFGVPPSAFYALEHGR